MAPFLKVHGAGHRIEGRNAKVDRDIVGGRKEFLQELYFGGGREERGAPGGGKGVIG